MSLRTKFCEKCGMAIDPGLATCPNCNTPSGTVFSDRPAAAPGSYRISSRQKIAQHISTHHAIEEAKQQANHSVIFALVSFFPIVGVFAGPYSIYIAFSAIRTLRAYQVEEGRGIGAAGLVIGTLSLLAQLSYVVMVMSAGPGARFFGF